ncbi:PLASMODESMATA CALLOSE-BINDING PROTEIN 2-like isoform X1 [Primulina huaijiensis]|uniref:PLASMODESMATA CALLOSE-BINDING PROTEIN 2-like isoform X1 n=1 Tax=Primulina huaijiensis TaxID=1492673 RepID=UPI003CC76C00
MAVFVVYLVILFAMAIHSDATYCVCNSGQSDSVLQKNIDYACGNGADCSAILQNGACFNPNTVKEHCNYAVNSYYQRKAQTSGSCVFEGTATVTANAPNAVSGCVYPSSSSNGGSSVGGTPTNSSGTNPGTFTGSTLPPGGSGFDSSARMTLLSQSTMVSMLLPFFFSTFFLYGLT